LNSLERSGARFAPLFALIGFVLSANLAFAQSVRSAQYTWKNVQIVGGGFVDGIIFHPTAPGVRYARTDMGGAYRWDATANRWRPMLDWVPYKDLNLMGVESIAVDPSNPRRVYLACGTYTNPRTPNGAILRSSDGGRTFQRTDVTFKFGGNEDGRGNGERLAVDPGDSRVLYLGTRHDGLWRSTDRGVKWERVSTFPDITEPTPAPPPAVPGETPQQRWQRMPVRGDGIVFVKFIPAPGKSAHPTRSIYIGVSLMNRPNLFVSRDSGQTWNPVPNEPTAYRPERAAVGSDGTLYVAYGDAPGPSPMHNGAVWKLDTRTGAWTDVTPDHPDPAKRPFGYAAVSVDAHNPRALIASSYNRYQSGGEELFRSTDAGATWKPIFAPGPAAGQYDYSAAPYVKATGIHWLFDIEIDPLNPDHAMFTTGYGGWETYDLTAADHNQPTHWKDFATGIEETVGLELASPASGAPLISAIGDYGGFTHWNLDRPAPDGSSAPPRFGNTTSVQAAPQHPEIMVRVGENAEHKPDANISYSLDGGRTWSGTAATPAPRSHSGTVAVSADGASWIWTPQGKSPYLTNDRGTTWTEVRGLSAGTRVIADAVNPHVFYAEDLGEGTLYRSSDSGATFSSIAKNIPPIPSRRDRGDERGGQDRIYAAPGHEGDLWFAAWDGIYRTQLDLAGGTPKTAPVAHAEVQEVHAFGFGKAAPGHNYPALYLVGTVRNQPGIFRSIDEGRTWTRINDDQHQWGLVLQITGDPKLFGRVYVGTHGRGIFYGDPAKR
jgi:photosystem II stability/assembly factor-like uncharacterized protein